MDEYDTLEKVQTLFNSMTPGEEWEGFFLGYDDLTSNAGFIGGQLNPYTALLFAIGKNGVAFFNLSKKSLLSFNRKNLYIEKDKYTYVPNNAIDKAKAKKYPIGSNVKLKMRLLSNQTINLIVSKEKDLPYQEAGRAALLNRFGK